MSLSTVRLTTREAARSHFSGAAAIAARYGHPVLANFALRLPTVPDLLAFFDLPLAAPRYRVYWEQPADGRAFVAVGAARVIETSGASRFRDAGTAIQRDMATAALDTADLAGLPTEPIYFGGFAFDPATRPDAMWRDFAPGLVVLPRILLAREHGAASVTLNAMVAPDADGIALADALLDEVETRLASAGAPATGPERARGVVWRETPSRSTWEGQVAAVTREIRAGRYDKVVLARRVTARGDSAFDAARALHELRASYPAAFVFAISSGQSSFLGASPELLIRRQGLDIEATSLAGSAPRGATAVEDRELAAALLASAKDHVEHAVVARAIQEALAPLCDDLFADPTPRLMQVRNVHHLYTPVLGRLNRARSVLELVERLHPTPAVGGYPRDLAMAAIREREELDRGWYAGPVGWVNGAGDGEFAVGIRSALLRGNEATLYAGCGIVGDSDPATEYRETLPKLRPMLDALGLVE